ncbi:MAG: hypothetical protein AB1778_00990 [Candidatus Bipolaricaulota bacterium]
MNGSSLVLALVLVGALLGALFFLTPPPVVPVETTGGSLESTVAAATPSSDALRVDVGPDQVIEERTSIRLVGVVAGAVEPVSVAWTADGGLGSFSDPLRLETSYTAASACGCDDCVTVTLAVVDAQGRTARDHLVISIRDELACPQPAPVCRCVEPDPCAPAPRSRCPEPVVACASPCITRAAVPTCNEVPVPCSCNACGPTWSPVWPAGSEPAPQNRPQGQIVSHVDVRVREGGAVPLVAVVRNPGCVSVCFTWSASRGTFEGADTLTPVYRAPQIDRPGGEDVTVTFVVRDAWGSRSIDQLRLRILDTSSP